MAIPSVEVPVYGSDGRDKSKKIVVEEFAGRMCLSVNDKEGIVHVECYFNDLERAWNAVKQ